MFSINNNNNRNLSSSQQIRAFALVLFVIYLSLLFYVTLFAWNYGASLGAEGPGGRNYNLIPFRSIYRISVFSKDIMDPITILLGNIVLFMPFGFLLPFAMKQLKKVILKVTIAGCIISIFIESSQFMFTYRVANIDDVILNTFGALVGVLLFVSLRLIKRRVIIFYNK
ncbi:VanZ family protein [Alkalihalobacterium chitinilyticum]|uniref:VanZ family protein n=1 Tax=Alkalihalobacterium chitinilyticum TaxID=2980103 RepID=UPI0027E51DC3|nr:VanZ family protein [Alkalihalobacterium chitinilyticum]